MITSENLQQRDVTFKPGDTAWVHYRVIEGNRERIQVFEGLVIARKGGGVNETFTVRKNPSASPWRGSSAPFAQDSEDRGRLQGRGASRQALLHQGQGRPQGEGQEGQEVTKSDGRDPLEERPPQGNPLYASTPRGWPNAARRWPGPTRRPGAPRGAARGRRGGPRRR